MSIYWYCTLKQFLISFSGDSQDDLLAGSTAGNPTVLLLNDKNQHLSEMADITICQLTELIDVIKQCNCYNQQEQNS